MRTRFFRARSARLAAIAAAMLCPFPAVAAGPDVIVGDIPDRVNQGVSGGKMVYSFGTTSCNLGDTPLTWVANSSVHPVISQNMYRLVNGRFEQIGQAWLKHGFCALQGTVCSSCTPGGDCSALFPGCSDPYSASLNGQQSGLGPKSEVNAATGAFPYPWVNNGESTVTTTTKRLAVLTTDLDAGLAGAGTFFFASMYVQPEDAAAGNDNNNQSYRRVTVGASPSYGVTLVDSTQRGKAAIYAWKDHSLGAGLSDSGVQITPVDVVSDGRFLVGAKATDLGGGQWRYEYAVQNLNSDRSGQAFSVPLPAGAVVTNIGFHDVDYTSGEPYSGIDWTSAVTGSSITWSTQTFALNVNANALRWDTIYNFRFDCNIPPAGGQATITLFKPGTPTSATAATIAPSADGQFHPLNDSCVNAADAFAGTTAFSNVGSTTDGPDEPTSCSFSSYTNIGSDIWFRYTSGSCTSGPTTIATCGSGFDTKIAVYPASCPTAGGTVIACNDDNTACGTSSLQSSLSFTAAANTAYLIRVGGYNALTGSGSLVITPPSCGPVAPANDLCANAAWIAHNVAVTGSTQLAANDGTANCGTSTTSPDVWYKYQPAVNFTNANFNACSSTYDTVLSVYTGVCGSLTQVACNDDNGGTGGNNACGGGLSSGLNYTVTAGTLYLIRVAGYQGATGTYTVKVVGGNGVIPTPGPANDACSARAGIGLGATEFTNVGATTDGPAHALCQANGSNEITGDLWWNFPATFTGRLKIDTCTGAGFDSRIAVYTGNGCTDFESRLGACSDDGSCTAGRAQTVVQVVAGQNYTIRVGGTTGATGAGTLTLTQLPCPADINGVGGVTIDDLFIYINIYFSSCTGQTGNPCNGLTADFNGVGGVTIDDLFLFINAYFTGC